MPKWVVRTMWALVAYTVLVLGTHPLGVSLGEDADTRVGESVLAAFGSVFRLVGIFGRDFRWGDGGEGAPMPEGLGNAAFILFSPLMILGGIAEILFP